MEVRVILDKGTSRARLGEWGLCWGVEGVGPMCVAGVQLGTRSPGTDK